MNRFLFSALALSILCFRKVTNCSQLDEKRSESAIENSQVLTTANHIRGDSIHHLGADSNDGAHGKCCLLSSFVFPANRNCSSVLLICAVKKLLNRTATAIPFICSFSGNCAASAPISTFMCLWAISVHICPPAEKADPSWEFIIRSLTHECRNWDWGPDIPFLGIFVPNFRHFVFAVRCRSALGLIKYKKERYVLCYRTLFQNMKPFKFLHKRLTPPRPYRTSSNVKGPQNFQYMALCETWVPDDKNKRAVGWECNCVCTRVSTTVNSESSCNQLPVEIGSSQTTCTAFSILSTDTHL